MGLLGDTFARGDSRTTTILQVVRQSCYVSNGGPFRVLLCNVNNLVVADMGGQSQCETMEVLNENEEEGTPRVGRDFDALAILKF